MTHSKKWIVYLFDPYFVGYVYVSTRREGRNILSRLRVEGFTGHVSKAQS